MEIQSSPPSFERQFSRKGRESFKEGNVSEISIEPSNLRDTVPVLFLPGWTENSSSYKRNMEIAYKSGRSSLFVDIERRGGEVPESDEYPRLLKRDADLVEKALSVSGRDIIDVIAHSRGAEVGLILAAENPGLVRNMVLDRMMGAAGSQDLRQMRQNWRRNFIQELANRPLNPADPASKIRALGRIASYVGANPSRAAEEAREVASFDATELVVQVKNQGTRLAFIAGTEDLLSPAIKQRAVFQEKGVGISEDFKEVAGTHNSLSIKPNLFTNIALDALADLQSKSL